MTGNLDSAFLLFPMRPDPGMSSTEIMNLPTRHLVYRVDQEVLRACAAIKQFRNDRETSYPTPQAETQAPACPPLPAIPRCSRA